MPLTGRLQNDISELMDQCKRSGKFGSLRKSSFKKCQKRALAAAYSVHRRKGGKRK